MRDLLICMIVLGSLPFIFRKPSVGIIMWIIFSVMNPHRLTYGFAHELPLAQVIAIATLLSLVMNGAQRRNPFVGAINLTALFVVFTTVTLFFAVYQSQSYDLWLRFVKVSMMTIAMVAVVRTSSEILHATYALVASLAFFGVKGGIFTIASGGNYLVWGPPKTMLEGNNELALGLIMIVPLLWFCAIQATNPKLRIGIFACVGLCVISAVGSHSRGAFLAIIGMSVFLIFLSEKKGAIGVSFLIGLPLLFLSMPKEWYSRMETIKEFDADRSALGRLNAWRMAINLANDRFFGGGFEIYSPEIFAQYSPVPEYVHAAHSIYFQVIGEHGWLGFLLWLSIWITAWFTARRIARAKVSNELAWTSRLARMIQVSLVGYAVGGAFLSLSYLDVAFFLVSLLVCMDLLVRESIRKEGAGVPQKSATPSFIRARRTN